jgi:23S rRNA pseudouridine1911/1915/1917 synthase
MKLKTVKKGEWLEVKLVSPPIGSLQNTLIDDLKIPQKLAAKLLRQGDVLLQGAKLQLHLFPAETDHYAPEWNEIEVLYEDDYCLVVNKPAGMPVHPSQPEQGGTLANTVASYYQVSGQACKIRHIHRLDDETTGPVLYAKHEFAQLVLDEAMREKQIDRRYTAVCSGRIMLSKGRIDAPIGRDRHHSSRRRVSPTGARAVTFYEVQQRFAEATQVSIQLETGRTHQIRVHCNHLGHPLLGDKLYGEKSEFISRQALHGEKLIFPHPLTKKFIHVEAPLPDDIVKLLKVLRSEPNLKL